MMIRMVKNQPLLDGIIKERMNNLMIIKIGEFPDDVSLKIKLMEILTSIFGRNKNAL